MNGSNEDGPTDGRGAMPNDFAAVLAAESRVRAGLAGGDWAAAASGWRELYTDTVARYCMAALGDAARVNEVVAEVWASAEGALATSDSTRTVRSILLGLARRRCARALEIGTVTQVPPLPSLANQARNLLVRLPPSEREILILRYVSRLSYTELSSIWEVDESEVRQRLSKAIVRATAKAAGEVQLHG